MIMAGRVPYWLRGYGNMAYILDDLEMVEEALTWIEAAFDSQREDGYFGPYIERNGKPDLWGNMVMIWVLAIVLRVFKTNE